MSDDLNLLLSNLNVFYRKLQNYHWNVTGEDFFTVHEKLEEYYNDINEQIDELAEHIISKGYRVFATMKEYLEASQIKEAESKKIHSDELWKEVLEGFSVSLNIRDAGGSLRYVDCVYNHKKFYGTNQLLKKETISERYRRGDGTMYLINPRTEWRAK